MGVQKRYRQGQILKLLAGQPVASQDELRRQLIHLGVRVTQATLSRDMRELRLVKTTEGYRLLSSASTDESAPLPTLAQRISTRYPPGAKHAGAENAPGWRTAARGRH